MTQKIDNAKIDQLKALIDERWALTKAARQHVPRDELGLMETAAIAAADATVEVEQEHIRGQVAAIGESLRGSDEMLEYYLALSDRHCQRYADALDHLWHGTHGWIE